MSNPASTTTRVLHLPRRLVELALAGDVGDQLWLYEHTHGWTNIQIDAPAPEPEQVATEPTVHVESFAFVASGQSGAPGESPDAASEPPAPSYTLVNIHFRDRLVISYNLDTATRAKLIKDWRDWRVGLPPNVSYPARRPSYRNDQIDAMLCFNLADVLYID